MKNITEMIDNQVKEISERRSNSPAIEQSTRDSGDFIHGMFKALKLTFPAWRQNFKTENEYIQTKAMWLKVLIDEKITSPDEIARGLKCARLHDSPFFPSIGQFIKWTQPEEIEAPRIHEDAYKQFVPKIAEHTSEEYKEMGERGLDKLKRLRGK